MLDGVTVSDEVVHVEQPRANLSDNSAWLRLWLLVSERFESTGPLVPRRVDIGDSVLGLGLHDLSNLVELDIVSNLAIDLDQVLLVEFLGRKHLVELFLDEVDEAIALGEARCLVLVEELLKNEGFEFHFICNCR